MKRFFRHLSLQLILLLGAAFVIPLVGAFFVVEGQLKRGAQKERVSTLQGQIEILDQRWLNNFEALERGAQKINRAIQATTEGKPVDFDFTSILTAETLDSGMLLDRKGRLKHGIGARLSRHVLDQLSDSALNLANTEVRKGLLRTQQNVLQYLIYSLRYSEDASFLVLTRYLSNTELQAWSHYFRSRITLVQFQRNDPKSPWTPVLASDPTKEYRQMLTEIGSAPQSPIDHRSFSLLGIKQIGVKGNHQKQGLFANWTLPVPTALRTKRCACPN